MPVALAPGELERYAPEPCLVSLGLVDQIDAPNVALAVEHVIVFMLPGAAFAGDVCAAKDQLGGPLRALIPYSARQRRGGDQNSSMLAIRAFITSASFCACARLMRDRRLRAICKSLPSGPTILRRAPHGSAASHHLPPVCLTIQRYSPRPAASRRLTGRHRVSQIASKLVARVSRG
jgi:hypothetical protein